MKTIVEGPTSVRAQTFGKASIETDSSSKVEFVELFLAQEKRIQRLEKVIVDLRAERDELLAREENTAPEAEPALLSVNVKEITPNDLPAIEASEFQPMVDYVPYSPVREATNRVASVVHTTADKSRSIGKYLLKKAISILT